MKKKFMKWKKSGFTLIELITVFVILAILAAIMIPACSGWIDKAKGVIYISDAKQAYSASISGLEEWKAAGSPGNGDDAYKINIESEIIKLLDLGPMQSFTKTKATENVVQVGLNLPSYYSQGWAQFITDCKANHYRNFVRVWVGKNPGGSIGDSIKAVYYVSPDGKYASRIVYEEGTKLGSVEQPPGTYYEVIN